jgi:MoxR-like ATPase
VTVLGETHSLPFPFFVLATQNPIELEGTYPLPEAQLDRFTFKINVHGVSSDTLQQIISTRRHGEPPELQPVLTEQQLSRLFDLTDAIHLPEAVANYIARIVTATQPSGPGSPEEVQRFVKFGASPRAAIGLANTARAAALLAGKPNVGFTEVKRVAQSVLGHRLILDYAARMEGWDTARMVQRLLEFVPEVPTDLPQDLQA